MIKTNMVLNDITWYTWWRTLCTISAFTTGGFLEEIRKENSIKTFVNDITRNRSLLLATNHPMSHQPLRPE